MSGLVAGFVPLACLFLLTAYAAEPAAKSPPPVVVDPAKLPAPQRVIVPKLQGALTLDGEFTEAVWSQAAVIGPFVLSGDAKPGREPTTVRLWYDDTALYLGYACADADIQATLTARDSRFWTEEVVEFFVTRQEMARYFELQWNPLAGTFDAVIANNLDERGVSKGINGDWSYTAKAMTSAVKVRGTVENSADQDESWQVEVVMPFADFGEPAPKLGDVWRGNFYRFNRGKDQPVEALAWSPTILPGFHQPMRFGYLEFGK